MVRLALSVLLAAAVVQIAAGYNFNRQWSYVKTYDSDYKLGQCVWTWLKTLYGRGYECSSDESSSDESFPRIKVTSKYIGVPYKDPNLKSVLPNIPCTQSRYYKVPRNAIACGYGWYLIPGQAWCICQGTVSCVNLTSTPTPTTTKATTAAPTTTKAQATPAPPSTTTTPAPTPAPTTPVAATTPPLVIVPTISSNDVANSATIVFKGRASYTLTFTVTAAPAPTSVTIASGTSNFVLSGSPGSLANTYVYRYTFSVVDSSYDGQLWTVTADNGQGTPGTYQFTIAINYSIITVTSPGISTTVAIQSSLLIAFQTRFCNGIQLTLGSNPFDLTSYGNGEYVGIYFDGNPGSFYTSNTDQGNTQTLPAGNHCPTTNGDFTANPFWILLQLTPVGSNYNVDLWTSAQFQYESPSNTTSKQSFQTAAPVPYQIGTVNFDLLGTTPAMPQNADFYYYEDAV